MSGSRKLSDLIAEIKKQLESPQPNLLLLQCSLQEADQKLGQINTEIQPETKKVLTAINEQLKEKKKTKEFESILNTINIFQNHIAKHIEIQNKDLEKELSQLTDNNTPTTSTQTQQQTGSHYTGISKSSTNESSTHYKPILTANHDAKPLENPFIERKKSSQPFNFKPLEGIADTLSQDTAILQRKTHIDILSVSAQRMLESKALALRESLDKLNSTATTLDQAGEEQKTKINEKIKAIESFRKNNKLDENSLNELNDTQLKSLFDEYETLKKDADKIIHAVSMIVTENNELRTQISQTQQSLTTSANQLKQKKQEIEEAAKNYPALKGNEKKLEQLAHQANTLGLSKSSTQINELVTKIETFNQSKPDSLNNTELKNLAATSNTLNEEIKSINNDARIVLEKVKKDTQNRTKSTHGTVNKAMSQASPQFGSSQGQRHELGKVINPSDLLNEVDKLTEKTKKTNEYEQLGKVNKEKKLKEEEEKSEKKKENLLKKLNALATQIEEGQDAYKKLSETIKTYNENAKETADETVKNKLKIIELQVTDAQKKLTELGEKTKTKISNINKGTIDETKINQLLNEKAIIGLALEQTKKDIIAALNIPDKKIEGETKEKVTLTEEGKRLAYKVVKSNIGEILRLARYYQEETTLAMYSKSDYQKLDELHKKIRKAIFFLKIYRDGPNPEKLNEQATNQKYKNEISYLDELNSLIKTLENAEGQLQEKYKNSPDEIIHYGAEAKLFDNYQEAYEQKNKYLGESPEDDDNENKIGFTNKENGNANKTRDFTSKENAAIRVVKHEYLNADGTKVPIVSVQQVSEGQYRSDIYGTERLASLGSRTSLGFFKGSIPNDATLLWAAQQIETFRAGNPTPDATIVIGGNKLTHDLAEALYLYAKLKNYPAQFKFNDLSIKLDAKELDGKLEDYAKHFEKISKPDANQKEITHAGIMTYKQRKKIEEKLGATEKKQESKNKFKPQ